MHLALQHEGPLQDEGLAADHGPDVLLVPDLLQYPGPLKKSQEHSISGKRSTTDLVVCWALLVWLLPDQAQS